VSNRIERIYQMSSKKKILYEEEAADDGSNGLEMRLSVGSILIIHIFYVDRKVAVKVREYLLNLATELI
jgi:hypothetical protein